MTSKQEPSDPKIILAATSAAFAAAGLSSNTMNTWVDTFLNCIKTHADQLLDQHPLPPSSSAAPAESKSPLLIPPQPPPPPIVPPATTTTVPISEDPEMEVAIQWKIKLDDLCHNGLPNYGQLNYNIEYDIQLTSKPVIYCTVYENTYGTQLYRCGDYDNKRSYACRIANVIAETIKGLNIVSGPGKEEFTKVLDQIRSKANALRQARDASSDTDTNKKKKKKIMVVRPPPPLPLSRTIKTEPL